MNKVLLVYPPYERLKGGICRDFPIGLGQLATMLDLKGYETAVYNADFQTSDKSNADQANDLLKITEAQSDYKNNFLDTDLYIWSEIKGCISRYTPDIVGIYTTTVGLPIVIKILNIIKDINPDCITILGGPHVTLLPDNVMKISQVDFAIMGEAEYSLPRLCDALQAGNNSYQSIPGLCYRNNDDVVINRNYEVIDNLDKLPHAKRELTLNEKDYPGYIIGGVIMGSRGCPYNCTFCASAAIWNRQVRYRNPEKIVEELSYLKNRYNIYEFSFWDDTFTIKKENVYKFCDFLMQTNMKFNWTISTRANLVDEDVVKKLKQAGCNSILIGIESGSDNVLKMMKKGITVAMVREAAKIIRKHGLSLGASFIVGLPYESADDMRKTINLINEIRPDGLNLSTFFPYPKTEAYEEVVRQGLFPDDYDWTKNTDLSHHSLINRFNAKVTDEEYRIVLQEGLELVSQLNKPTMKKKMKRYWHNRHRYMEDPVGLVQRLVKRRVG